MNNLSYAEINDIGESIIECIEDLENETIDLGSFKTSVGDLAQDLIDANS